MKKKVIIVLCSLYLIQFIVSCCPDAGTYEVTHIGIQGAAMEFTDDGYRLINGSTPVDKESLAIEGAFDLQQDRIASVFTELKGFGFENALATTCPDPNLIYLTNLTSIKIEVEDMSNNQISDISSDFVATGLGREMTLEEYIQAQDEERYYRYDYFRFKVNTIQNIPSQAIFKVSVLLTSGDTLSFETNEINFN